MKRIPCAVDRCPLTVFIELVGGKWKLFIMWYLRNGAKRFTELKSLIPNCTHKMLTQQLKELETDYLINRKVYAQVPPKVEYSLTEYGQSLMPVICTMRNWSTEYLKTIMDNYID